MVRNPQLVRAATCTVANSVQEGVNLHRETVGVEEPMFSRCAFQLLHYGLAPWMPRSPVWGVCASAISASSKRCTLGAHKTRWQHKSKHSKWEQLGDFFKSAFWTCAVTLK